MSPLRLSLLPHISLHTSLTQVSDLFQELAPADLQHEDAKRYEYALRQSKGVDEIQPHPTREEDAEGPLRAGLQPKISSLYGIEYEIGDS
jgi:hypothetical protein